MIMTTFHNLTYTQKNIRWSVVFSKEKSIKAIVVDKQSYDKQIYRKGQAPFTVKEYVITFRCGNKKKYFNVSELSYKNYRVNQKGTLNYKGSRIVDFK